MSDLTAPNLTDRRANGDAADPQSPQAQIARLLRDGLIRNVSMGLTVDASAPDGEAFVRGRLDLALLADTIMPVIDDLLASEREACARIADRQGREFDAGTDAFDRGLAVGSRETARMIADLIRSRR